MSCCLTSGISKGRLSWWIKKDAFARRDTHTQPFQTSKLFLKLGVINFKFVEELKDIDEISYCYVMTKFDKTISDSEAKIILRDNYKDERIGLLLWSFGQMGLWDRIVEYDNDYREKHTRANLL